MRPYSPGGALSALASALQGSIPATPSAHRLQRGLPGYLILLLPTLSRLSVSTRPGSRLRHWCSSQYLRISPLHWEFRYPLRDSSQAVSEAVPRLSRGISRPTCPAACAPFTPNNSEQRWPPPYYRGCWHGVSRGFLQWYRQLAGVLVRPRFVPLDRSLRPEGLRPPRGVAASGFPPLRKIPHCCLP